MKIKEGKKAPAFALKDRNGETHRLSKIDSDYVVLFFYPKDSTPGCTIEASEFTKDLKKFEKAGATVIGISGGDEKSKAKFCEKHNLKTLLLSDTDFSISDKYGVYGEKKFMGRTFMGINRTTFVIGPDRKVIKVFDKVKPKGHSREVLTVINGS